MKDQLTALLRPVVARFGLELEAVDVTPAGKRRVLRVVVDGDGPNGSGPLLDDIAEATKAISVALDGSDLLGAQPYTLEVSSRGVDRPLEQPRHWRRNAGRLVTVTSRSGERFLGRIVASENDHVVLAVEGVARPLPYAEVANALVQVELNRPSADPRED
jgi:ribosome maturation factor RimP